MVVLYRRYIAYGSSQSPDEELYRGDVNPRLGARNRRLEILRQAAVAIEPSQGPFDDPAPRQQLKADSVSGAFDDLDGPFAEFGESFGQVGAVVDTVGEEMAQPGKQLVDGLDDQHGTIAILDIGGVHLGADQQTASIGHNVALTPFDLLGRIVTTRSAQRLGRRHMRLDQPPFSIGQIACVAPSLSLILASSGFGPHLVPR